MFFDDQQLYLKVMSRYFLLVENQRKELVIKCNKLAYGWAWDIDNKKYKPDLEHSADYLRALAEELYGTEFGDRLFAILEKNKSE